MSTRSSPVNAEKFQVTIVLQVHTSSMFFDNFIKQCLLID